MLRYNYIIHSVKADYMSAIFNDVANLENVEYIPDYISYYKYNKIVKVLNSAHLGNKINKICKLPGKEIWSKVYFQDRFNNDNPRCFIFFMDWLRPKNEFHFIELRRLYPDAKLVIYFEDIISSRKYLDMSLIKHFDLAISFDFDEAQRYGLTYYPTMYSKLDLGREEKDADNDIFFCGAAKNRHDEIKDVYNFFKAQDVKQQVIVTRTPPEVDKIEGIEYYDSDISYFEYLDHATGANCLLEIIQKNSSGYTLRTWEALAYKKKLITNNRYILDAPFYNEDQFCYFSEVEDIPIDFITTPLKSPNMEYIKEISPRNFLQRISDLLNK